MEIYLFLSNEKNVSFFKMKITLILLILLFIKHSFSLLMKSGHSRSFQTLQCMRRLRFKCVSIWQCLWALTVDRHCYRYVEKYRKKIRNHIFPDGFKWSGKKKMKKWLWEKGKLIIIAIIGCPVLFTCYCSFCKIVSVSINRTQTGLKNKVIYFWHQFQWYRIDQINGSTMVIKIEIFPFFFCVVLG